MNIERAARWAALPAAVVALVAAAPPANALEWIDPGQTENQVIVTNEWRYLSPWASEKVPGYQCPDTHPYLVDRSFAPWGTSLIKGVEIDQNGWEPWPIGVSITIWSTKMDPATGKVHSSGITSAPLASSATNWDPLVKRAYRVKLHCTSSPAEAFDTLSAR